MSDEKIKIMEELDIDGFINFMIRSGIKPPSTRHIALMAIHKARCRHPGISEKLKHESKLWLNNTGCQRF